MLNEHPSFNDWNRVIGDLFTQLHTMEFPALALEAIRSQVSFDIGTCCCVKDGIPIGLYGTGIEPGCLKYHLEPYVSGAYLLDPVYNAFYNGQPSGFYRLSELAPDDFYQSEYFRAYYAQLNLVDEVYFVSVLSPENMISFAISRSDGHPEFTDLELQRFRQIEPIMCQSAPQFLLTLDEKAAPKSLIAPDIHRQLEAAYKNFGTSILTERECELVHLLLRGHSNQSAADKMEISRDTVKMHRKNINSKLDISSQAELFALFIDSLTCIQREAGQDPLAIYLNSPKPA